MGQDARFYRMGRTRYYESMKKPECVGPYTLLSPLGEGAHVWLASMGDGRRLVLKLARAGNKTGRARLLHEVHIAGAFDHPNIVRMYECGEAQGVLWMATGHVAGPSVPLTLANFRQLLLALVHVHAHGVVHGAIAPAHLLLDEDANLRLAGFADARREGAVQDDLRAAGEVLLLIVAGKPDGFAPLIAKLRSPDAAARHISAFDVLRDFDAACPRGVRSS
jgi:serine/threonine protein kinase